MTVALVIRLRPQCFQTHLTKLFFLLQEDVDDITATHLELKTVGLVAGMDRGKNKVSLWNTCNQIETPL
jgi:hypothetical protein